MARLGGDEFVVAAGSLSGELEAVAHAARLLAPVGTAASSRARPDSPASRTARVRALPARRVRARGG